MFWKAVDILACKIKPIAKLYDKTVGKIYREEREQFDLSKSQKILHVGCGSYPITAMVLAEMDNVNVVTIDGDIKSLKRADKILNKKNLNGKIKAVYGDGTRYPLNEFDTIVISGCSVPKAKVMEHVFNNAKPQSKIIVRTSFIDVESIIKNLNHDIDVTIIDKKENYLSPTISWDSILIVKNN